MGKGGDEMGKVTSSHPINSKCFTNKETHLKKLDTDALSDLFQVNLT